MPGPGRRGRLSVAARRPALVVDRQCLAAADAVFVPGGGCRSDDTGQAAACPVCAVGRLRHLGTAPTRGAAPCWGRPGDLTW